MMQMMAAMMSQYAASLQMLPPQIAPEADIPEEEEGAGRGAEEEKENEEEKEAETTEEADTGKGLVVSQALEPEILQTDLNLSERAVSEEAGVAWPETANVEGEMVFDEKEEEVVEPGTAREDAEGAPLGDEVKIITVSDDSSEKEFQKEMTAYEAEGEEFDPLNPQDIIDEEEAERQRFRAERKRKGKLLARLAAKRAKASSETLAIREQSQLSWERGRLREAESSEEERREEEEEEQPRYKKLSIIMDRLVLQQMTEFDDSKVQEECAGRLTGGKKVKSGKRLHRPSLRELGAEEKFLEYMSGIGFEWLLEFNSADIPIALAQEFFTSFHFKATTDVTEKSISFRIFGRQVKVSLTEWSIRLGLYTEEQAREREWSARQLGQLKSDTDFDPQAA
ncbi:hypothetical protein AAHA92_32978 [Salvia divinorum]